MTWMLLSVMLVGGPALRRNRAVPSDQEGGRELVAILAAIGVAVMALAASPSLGAVVLFVVGYLSAAAVAGRRRARRRNLISRTGPPAPPEPSPPQSPWSPRRDATLREQLVADTGQRS